MAATDARPVPRKNTAYRFYFAIRKNDGTLITTWTGADSEVSIDGAAFADCTNEATEVGTSGCGYIDFTAAEMNGDAVQYKLTVTNTDALPIVVTFYPEENGDYRVDVDDLPTNAELAASFAALNDLAAADVAQEIADALSVDTYAEPSGVPAFPMTLAEMIRRIAGALVLGLVVTDTKLQFKNAAGVVVWEKDLSDDGTTYEETAGNAP